MMTATTDRAALYRSILERPEDDVVRRVFADYLRENGEESRADFIEVQLELADEPHHGRRHFDRRYSCPEPWQGFRCREEQLWHEDERKWFNGPGKMSFALAHEVNAKGSFVGIVSRGFVSTVRTTLADWLRHGPRIVAGQPVEEVRTDAVADPIGDEWCWVKDRPELLGSARIPPEVFNLLEGGRLESGGNEWQDHFGVEDFWRIYPTEAAAQSALSLALVNWARREAGLPPLREHATH